MLGTIHGTSSARWDTYRPGTASLTEVQWEGSQGRLVHFDDRRHLAAG